jgi:hypothetical protein
MTVTPARAETDTHPTPRLQDNHPVWTRHEEIAHAARRGLLHVAGAGTVPAGISREALSR